MPFLGRIQGCDLPGEIVVPGPSCELVHAHRHTHPKGVQTACAVKPTRVFPECIGCVVHRIVGYVKHVEIVVMTTRVVSSGLRPSKGSGVDEEMVMSQQAMRQAD
jgi:hypothetical protein